MDHTNQERPHGPIPRYVKLRVAHEAGMPGKFSPSPQVGDPDMHHGTCVTDVPWCMPGSLTNGFFWSRWQEKRYRHSRCMRNPQFYVSGKKKKEQQTVCTFADLHCIFILIAISTIIGQWLWSISSLSKIPIHVFFTFDNDILFVACSC